MVLIWIAIKIKLYNIASKVIAHVRKTIVKV